MTLCACGESGPWSDWRRHSSRGRDEANEQVRPTQCGGIILNECRLYDANSLSLWSQERIRIMDSVLWSAVSSAATVTGAVVVVYAAIVAVRQLKEMTRTRYLEAMLRVYELISSDDARDTRRYIYSELRSTPDALTLEEQRQVEKASVLLDRVGSLVAAGLVPADLVLSSHSTMIANLWDRLEPYIRFHRSQRYESYVRYFEELAIAAKSFQAKGYSNQSVRRGLGARKRFDWATSRSTTVDSQHALSTSVADSEPTAADYQGLEASEAAKD